VQYSHAAAPTRGSRDVPRQLKYTKVIFRVPGVLADEAAGVLVTQGALGCAVGGMSRPGARVPRTIALEAYFERGSEARIDNARRMLEASGMAARKRPAIRTIVDPGWVTMWQWKFAPFRIGKRFLIVPPWDRRREPQRISIIIEPGRAFGTGHHPSTAGALRVIETLLANGCEARAALDVGAGSGILSIAMVRCGVPKVVAIDIDSDALENAWSNVEQNGVGSAIRLSAVPLNSVRGRFELITANILATVLTEVAAELKRRLAPGGKLVLGGILAREAPELRRHYQRLGLKCLEQKTAAGWTTLVFAQ